MIVPVNRVRNQFRRCHYWILNKIKGQYPDQFNLHKAEEFWNRELGIKIHRGEGFAGWSQLEFTDEQSYMLWLLRWS